MEKWIGGLLADVSPPEGRKFKSPLILVHGLWSGSWCWRSWATQFCNLGWECWAVNLRGRYGDRAHQILERLSFQTCVEDLEQVVDAASFPPVILGHCLGGLMALKAVEKKKLSALIFLSPIPSREIDIIHPRSLRLLRLKYLPLIFLRRPFRPEEKDLRKSWLASVPRSQHSDILKQMVPESGHLIRELFKRRVEVNPDRIHCPILVVCGSEDRVMPIASMREMAARLGGEFKDYPDHGHWMMEEEGGEGIVREIHRWVIQSLGEEILLADFSGAK